jgi:hypothetical protein
MGYRLDYSVSGGVLMVTISGSCPTPGAIARDIGREARENAVRNVLVDVRRLQDRIGKIRDLLADKDGYRAIDGTNKANGRDITLLDGTKIFLGGSSPLEHPL